MITPPKPSLGLSLDELGRRGSMSKPIMIEFFLKRCDRGSSSFRTKKTFSSPFLPGLNQAARTFVSHQSTTIAKRTRVAYQQVKGSNDVTGESHCSAATELPDPTDGRTGHIYGIQQSPDCSLSSRDHHSRLIRLPKSLKQKKNSE